MTPAEAFAAIPLAAVCSDSSFERQEARILRHQLEPRWPYRTMTPLAIGELVDGLLRRIRHGRWQDLIAEAAKQLTPSQQETAFAIAAQLIFCDRVVTQEEQDFLIHVADELALPEGRARQIVEVLHLLNVDALRPPGSRAGGGG